MYSILSPGAWLDLICGVSQCSLWCLQGMGCVFLSEFTTVQCSASQSRVFIKSGGGSGKEKEKWNSFIERLLCARYC